MHIVLGSPRSILYTDKSRTWPLSTIRMSIQDDARRTGYNRVMYEALLRVIETYDKFASPAERMISDAMGNRRDQSTCELERRRLLEEITYLDARVSARQVAAGKRGTVATDKDPRIEAEEWIQRCRIVRATMDEANWIDWTFTMSRDGKTLDLTQWGPDDGRLGNGRQYFCERLEACLSPLPKIRFGRIEPADPNR